MKTLDSSLQKNVDGEVNMLCILITQRDTKTCVVVQVKKLTSRVGEIDKEVCIVVSLHLFELSYGCPSADR